MALSDQELLLLDNLIYFDGVMQEGDTVAQILDKVTYELENNPGSSYGNMSKEEWLDVVSAIQNHRELCEYQVTNLNTPSDDIDRGTVACFVSDKTTPPDVNVIFKGTQNGYEWDDNGEGAYLIDSDCQKAAEDYINQLPKEYGDNITVSGHSKGGNKAQYVTITTDRVKRCVSEDGQGFSNEFCKRYEKEIAEKQDCIINYCAENDYVNIIGNDIAGETVYIKTGFEMIPFYYHKPNLIFGENGELNEIGEQAGWTKYMQEYLDHVIDTMPEPQRTYVIDGLMGLLEGGESEESWYNKLYTLLTAGGYWLAWMIEREDWFGEAGTALAEFIREATKIFSPSYYYDMTYFSVTIENLRISQENIQGCKVSLEQMAEDILQVKQGLKGITYGGIRASMDVLRMQLQARAEACQRVSDALDKICRDYQETEQHVQELF